MISKALTIADSDTSDDAGIQADLKTFQERQVYGMTALTTIVTMDPANHWSHHVHPIAIETLQAQLDTALSTNVHAVKTGMLGSEEVIKLVATTIENYQIKNFVVDPVMVCKGADEALHPELNECLRHILVTKALIVTPNLFEAYQLCEIGQI